MYNSFIYKNNWSCVCVPPTFQVNPFNTPLSFLYIKPLSHNELIKDCPMHHRYYNIRAQSPSIRLSNKARMQAIKKEVGRVLE